MLRSVQSPATAPVSTHRRCLDRSYFPIGNEDKDHAVKFPLVPVDRPLLADRVYADPYGPNREVLIDRNGADFVFQDHERGLANELRRTLRGNILQL